MFSLETLDSLVLSVTIGSVLNSSLSCVTSCLFKNDNCTYKDLFILFSSSVKYYTVYSLVFAILAFIFQSNFLIFVSQCLLISGPIIFHIVSFFDVTLLSYYPEDIIVSVTSYKVPLKKYLVSWAEYHFRNSILPIYMYFRFDNEIKGSNYSAVYILLSMLLLVGYFAVHSLYWHINKEPVYPLMSYLRNSNNELLFYVACIAFYIIINCFVAGMYNELFFYLLSFVVGFSGLFGWAYEHGNIKIEKSTDELWIGLR